MVFFIEMNKSYDFEIDRIVEEVKASKANVVGLQFPEGLRVYAVDVAREVEKRVGCKVVVFIDPVYGVCDVKLREAEVLGVDLIVHFGHTTLKPVLGGGV